MPIRLRVALVVAATMGLALAGLGVFVYLRLASTLDDQTRRTLDAQLDTLSGLSSAQQVEAARESSGAVFAQVLRPDGDLLATSPQVEDALVTPGGPASTSASTSYDEVAVRLTGDDEQEPATIALRRSGDRVLLVGQSREATEEALEALLTQLLVGGPLALLLAAGAGYAAAAAALRPIERMRWQAAAIGDDSHGERLSLPAVDDEVRRLGTTLNAMLDRLERGLARERRFVAEAGHELRTPLALLKTELELARSHPRSEDEIGEALRSAEEEVDRLARLAEDLLLLTTSETAALELDRREVDVGALLHRSADRFGPAARDAGRTIEVVEVVGGLPLTVSADPDRLDRVLVNLVDNALRHGSGTVRLAAAAVPGGVELSVADEGRGPDPEREGHGLGLSIVRALLDAHGATLGQDTDEAGTRVVVTFPAAGSATV